MRDDCNVPAGAKRKPPITSSPPPRYCDTPPDCRDPARGSFPGWNRLRNSMCSLKFLKLFLVVLGTPRRSPTILPGFHSSAFLPSKRTTAPSGDLAPSVGLLRSTREKLRSSLFQCSAFLPTSIVP